MIRINLLPPEIRKKAKKSKPTKAKAAAGPKINLKFDPVVALAVIVAALAVLSMAGAQFWLGHSKSSLQTKRAEVRTELNLLSQVVQKIDDLKARNAELGRKMAVIVKVDSNRYLWPQILDEISTSLPSYTWLDIVSETTPLPQMHVRLEGVTMNNLLLGRLLENLERSSLLDSVSLISSSEHQEGPYDTRYFIIQCACALNEPPGPGQTAPGR